MATFTWYLQGTSPTTIEATDKFQFAGGTFDSAITVGAYNTSSHVKSSGGADDSSGNTPKNSKFVSQTGGTGGDSQVDVGGGTVDLDSISTANCPLKINFSHGSSVVTTGCIFYAYDGTTTTAAPTGVTFIAAEQGDANWTAAEGSAAGVTITDDTTATSHDYYILLSASPDSVGLKSAFKLRIELTYSGNWIKFFNENSMKSNSTYTVLEILKATGAEKFTIDEKEYTPEEVFGKAAVMIGGIRGIVDPEKIINIPTETECLEVMVGINTFTIAIEKNEGDKEHSEGVQAVRDANVPEIPEA